MCDPRTVTLAIPCYNAAEFIGPTLASVDGLDPPPGEVIVVDDGSTDGSGEIAASFPDVRLIVHGENMGIARARNTALENARADIIVFIDADVIACKSLLEKICTHYESERVAGVGGQGKEVVQRSRYDRWRGEVLFQGWGDRVRKDVPFLFGLCSSYRKDALQEVGGFNPVFRSSGEDMDMGFRLRKAGFNLMYEPGAAVDHIRSDNRESIEKMTYRHCYWGFVAQRLNRCFDNKLPLARSVKIFMKQVLGDGIAKGDFNYSLLAMRQHWIIVQAWIDAARTVRSGILEGEGTGINTGWEGHRSSGGSDDGTES